MKNVRVAALQFATGTVVEKNKIKTLEMIDQASIYKPDLIVTPEFCNHASWYSSPAHCYDVSLAIDDDFLIQTANKAKLFQSYIVLNVTLRKGSSHCTGSSILFDRKGKIVTISHKQVLMGHENIFLTPGTEKTQLGETDFGLVGLYACMDGVIFETPRDLAARGALILCNSLNSFASDEAQLHVPVRAAENKVFVVAANKVGPLIPEDQLDGVSAMIHVPRHFLYGAGESQIVAPCGSVLAKASTNREEVTFAEIDPQHALDKIRPSGTHIFHARRPELYRSLYTQTGSSDSVQPPPQHASVKIALWQGLDMEEHPEKSFLDRLPEISTQADILLLPQLFWLKSLSVANPHDIVEQSTDWIKRIKNALGSLPLSVCSSFFLKRPEGLTHTSLLLNKEGVVLEQPQIHRSKRTPDDLLLGHKMSYWDSPFGRIALITGEDAVFGELYRLLAFQGVDLVLIPSHAEERWEMETGLPERSAENRMTLAFASRPTPVGASLCSDLEEDFTLMTPWKSRIFDGKISAPLLFHSARHPGVRTFTLHPSRSRHKLLSGETHVVRSHPKHFYQ